MSIPSLRHTLSLYVLPLLMLSCQQLNPEFCTDHPDDAVCLAKGDRVDGGRSSVASCTSNAECTSPTPICDTARSRCAQCTAAEPGACGGTTPTCGNDGTCRSCSMDSDCESSTCLPDGSCEPAVRVLYAAPNGTLISNCAPTDKCALRRALALIDGTKTTIRLDAGQYDLVDPLALTGTLRLVGRGAVFDASSVPVSSGPFGEAVSIGLAGSANIELDYITVQHGHGAGILGSLGSTLIAREVTVKSNAGDGIFCLACKMTITHSLITGNGAIGFDVFGNNSNDFPAKVAMTRSVVSGNSAGGVQLEKTSFDLENNFIVQNGSPVSPLGGVLIEAADPGDPAGRFVFAFNTVALNLASVPPVPGQSGGVLCTYTSTFALVLTNNIMFENSRFYPTPQFGGINCSIAYSDVFGPGSVPLPGAGNLLVDPLFVDLIHSDFHLLATSPLRDAADPAATLAVDIDGDARPQGAGRDMGADEIQ